MEQLMAGEGRSYMKLLVPAIIVLAVLTIASYCWYSYHVSRPLTETISYYPFIDITSKPLVHNVLVNRGYLNLLDGDYIAARDDFLSAIAKDRDNPSSYYGLALAADAVHRKYSNNLNVGALYRITKKRVLESASELLRLANEVDRDNEDILSPRMLLYLEGMAEIVDKYNSSESVSVREDILEKLHSMQKVTCSSEEDVMPEQ
jgi:tetratricopeptide (TPR) repeat protein